ncbi:MAG: DinB family protein [Planctomycetes bacterium]|nr:DinB family protein [Planctomycetota bacterium]
MNPPALVDALERFGTALPALLAGITPDDARWRPPDDAWSIVEVAMHLADEEERDFRVRLELTLTDPTAPWPPIDPEGWAVERNYRDADLADTVERFVRERRHSITWLRGLDAPDWSREAVHPRFGPMRAGDLLTSWTAHDTLHLRQVAKRLFQLAARDGAGYRTDYAGEWSA